MSPTNSPAIRWRVTWRAVMSQSLHSDCLQPNLGRFLLSLTLKIFLKCLRALLSYLQHGDKNPIDFMKVKMLVAQLCPPFCNPMDCSPSRSSVHGILQARILEWVATPSSRGSSQPRDQTQVSPIVGGFRTA